MTEEAGTYVPQGATAVVLEGGPLDGKRPYIYWTKGKGTPPPSTVIVTAEQGAFTVEKDPVVRYAVYELIDNWPLRYQWRGFQSDETLQQEIAK